MSARAVALGAAVLATGCAFTDYGNRINKERAALEDLEQKRSDYEARYIIALNNLEKNLDDLRSENEKARIRKRIQELNSRLAEKRQSYDRSIQEWEQKILQDKIQKAMEDKAVKEGDKKQDGEWEPGR